MRTCGCPWDIRHSMPGALAPFYPGLLPRTVTTARRPGVGSPGVSRSRRNLARSRSPGPHSWTPGTSGALGTGPSPWLDGHPKGSGSLPDGPWEPPGSFCPLPWVGPPALGAELTQLGWESQPRLLCLLWGEGQQKDAPLPGAGSCPASWQPGHAPGCVIPATTHVSTTPLPAPELEGPPRSREPAAGCLLGTQPLGLHSPGLCQAASPSQALDLWTATAPSSWSRMVPVHLPPCFDSHVNSLLPSFTAREGCYSHEDS